MKNLKFLITVMAMFVAGVALAVQLPSTSYTPVDVNTYSDEIFTTGTMYKGGFYALGETSCAAGSETECSSCCESELGTSSCIDACGEDVTCMETCLASVQTCVETCMKGDKDPLDGDSPLDESAMLLILFSALILGAGIVRMYAQKKV